MELVVAVRTAGQRFHPADHLPHIAKLLQAGADVNQRDEDGWTSLMHAVANGDGATIELLINFGSDHSLKTPSGLDALQIAVLWQNPDAVQRLLYNHRYSAAAIGDALLLAEQPARRRNNKKMECIIEKLYQAQLLQPDV